MNRNKWEFEQAAGLLAEAAAAKQQHHQERAAAWEAKLQEVMAQVKEGGLEIGEPLALSMASSSPSRGPRVMVRTDLQEQVTECHDKVRSHAERAREYDGWRQVLGAQPELVLKLDHDDWLFFFGEHYQVPAALRIQYV